MNDVERKMKALECDAPGDETVDVKAAYARFEATAVERRRTTGRTVQSWRQWVRLPQLGAATAILAVAVVVALTPVRSLGQRFLQMLRVQKVAVVRIENPELLQDTHSRASARALSQLISDNVVVTMKPGEAVKMTDLGTASAAIGFHVQALATLGTPARIAVLDQGAFHMTLDADKIRAVFEEAGRSDIRVPDSVAGSTIAVHVGKGALVSYGNCAESKGSRDESCVHFLQIPVPNISVPPNLDMAALAEAGLELSGLSASEANRVAHTIDWSSTLVIPIPEDTATYQTVPVDGANGILITYTPRGGSAARYDLIWVKNGVVHSISGVGNSARVLAAASDLG